MHRPKRWNIAEPHPAAEDLAARLKLSPLLAQLLLNRGISDPIDGDELPGRGLSPLG